MILYIKYCENAKLKKKKKKKKDNDFIINLYIYI